MTFRPPTRFWKGTAALVVLTGLGISVSLLENSTDPVTTAPGTAAMRVAIDPDTGLLVPALVGTDKAQDAELAEMLSRSSEGLVEVHHPDGHVYVDLQGRFMSVSLARVDGEGNVETTCVEDAAQAESFLAGDDASQWEVQ